MKLKVAKTGTYLLAGKCNCNRLSENDCGILWRNG